MKSADNVLYFIVIAVIVILSIVFIWFFLSEDIRSPPTDIFSVENNLYCTSRTFNNIEIMTADSTKDNFNTTWNLVFDATGTGTCTFRNAFTGKWIYFVPDDEGNAPVVTVDLDDRQDATIDPIGWFIIKAGSSTGKVKFESYQAAGKYLSVTPVNSFSHPYSLMFISNLESEFILKT